MPMPRLSGETNMFAPVSTWARPLTATNPCSGLSRPAMQRSVVLLPHPLGPSSVNSLPLERKRIFRSPPPVRALRPGTSSRAPRRGDTVLLQRAGRSHGLSESLIDACRVIILACALDPHGCEREFENRNA